MILNYSPDLDKSLFLVQKYLLFSLKRHSLVYSTVKHNPWSGLGCGSVKNVRPVNSSRWTLLKKYCCLGYWEGRLPKGNYIDFKSRRKWQFLRILCMFSHRGVFYVPIVITVVFCNKVLIVFQSTVEENILATQSVCVNWRPISNLTYTSFSTVDFSGVTPESHQCVS